MIRKAFKLDFYFQVLDTDLVQEEECNDNWYEKVSEKQDCQSVNDRFYEKCPYYNNCGNGGGNRRMFKCSTVRSALQMNRDKFCIILKLLDNYRKINR